MGRLSQHGWRPVDLAAKRVEGPNTRCRYTYMAWTMLQAALQEISSPPYSPLPAPIPPFRRY